MKRILLFLLLCWTFSSCKENNKRKEAEQIITEWTLRLHDWKQLMTESENHIQQLNHFPEKTEYQCFLLDKNNQVVMVGNPVKS